MRNSELSRRQLLSFMGLGLGASCGAGWLPALAESVATDPRRRRHCILLWMNGGPSQTDTFDMKPGHANGGEFKEIATRAPGLRFSEHLSKLADHAEQLAVVRSISTTEGDHARGTHLVRTGHPPAGGVAYPSIACSLAKQLESHSNLLPNYVSVAPRTQVSPASFGPGFLGQSYAPAIVGGISSDAAASEGAGERAMDLKLEHIDWPAGVDSRQGIRRRQLWEQFQKDFLQHRHVETFRAHDALIRNATEMMRPEVRQAFDLAEESESTRSKYGPGLFGQGCLLARRLVERGVPFVEVALGDGLAWDTHKDNFSQVRSLSEQLDAGWANLMTELKERDLLESTTILWMGEFGRTPTINGNAGRDHFPAAWSCVFAGGGIEGGQAYGRTSAEGTVVEENQVGIGDVLATLCTAMGVSPKEENVTPAARPVKLAEGTPIREILA